jgi:hypothetical protein
VTACNNSRIKYIFLVKKYIFRTDQKRFSCSPEIKSQKPKSQFLPCIFLNFGPL